MSKIKIKFPWFPSEIEPNARCYYKQKNTKFQSYKGDCHILASITKPRDVSKLTGIEIIFNPPRMNRDLDNCLASCKAMLDGIAQAWECNDKIFRPITIDFGERDKQGSVEFTAHFED